MYKKCCRPNIKSLEIILVDDGSPGSCSQMGNEWTKKANRIKVIHKENADPGMARNTGIENTNGKWIFFFNSDDYVALDTVEKVFEIAEWTNTELIIYCHKDVDGNGNIKNYHLQLVIQGIMYVKNHLKGGFYFQQLNSE